MKDNRFIDEMISRAEEARKKVRDQLEPLSLTQLNWKPGPDQWSIGQCLDHLVVSDCTYFPVFKKIMEGDYPMSFWEKWSPFSGLFGHMLVTQVQEIPRKKMVAPRIFRPSESNIDAGISERFHKHFDSLLEFTASFAKQDIDRLKIHSPVSTFITYSLRNALKLIIQHAHRHINQAIRVKQNKDFPQQ